MCLYVHFLEECNIKFPIVLVRKSEAKQRLTAQVCVCVCVRVCVCVFVCVSLTDTDMIEVNGDIGFGTATAAERSIFSDVTHKTLGKKLDYET